MNFEDYLEVIEGKLRSCFDMERDYVVGGYRYDFFGEYHLRNERYVLHKKVTIYAIENNEYCFMKYFKEFNHRDCDAFIDALVGSVDGVVRPNEDHMSSVITGIIVLDDRPHEDVIDRIGGFKYHKGFAFGFKGWADIRLLLVTLNDGLVITNKKGREVSEVYHILPSMKL